MEFWGQVVSVAAMVAMILSFQCKSNMKLTMVMGMGALLFALSYLMLGQPSAALFNIVAVICSLVCMKEKLKNRLVFFGVALLYIIATCLAFDNWWTIVLMSAQIATSYSLMFRSGKFIRNMRFFFVSPVWLVNNTVMCFSVGGTICEVITMVSVIVSFVRYKKTGFEE